MKFPIDSVTESIIEKSGSPPSFVIRGTVTTIISASAIAFFGSVVAFRYPELTTSLSFQSKSNSSAIGV